MEDDNIAYIRTRNSDFEDDYDFTRGTLYKLVNEAAEVLPHLKDLAMASEHPKMFEVYFKSITWAADVNDRLMELQRKTQVMERDGSASRNNLLNNLKKIDEIEGEADEHQSTTDILDMIEKERKQ